MRTVATTSGMQLWQRCRELGQMLLQDEEEEEEEQKEEEGTVMTTACTRAVLAWQSLNRYPVLYIIDCGKRQNLGP